MKIFLVGFMGCGKSTKAKQLANLLDCPVVDIDAVIVEQEGMSINDYFAANGEAGFRALERKVLHTYPYPETCIIATGGGLPCFFDNMEWMKAHGRVVYLEMTPSQLVSRLVKREKRPLIKDMDDEQLLAFITEKLEERKPFYTKAQYVVNAFDLDPKALLEQVQG